MYIETNKYKLAKIDYNLNDSYKNLEEESQSSYYENSTNENNSNHTYNENSTNENN